MERHFETNKKDLKCYLKYMEKPKWKNLNTCKRV